MRMAVHNKICSRKGASITFALLAFLVCAVIGAVVLSAAITTSGRASGIAEMDQRYYAVSSAAQLFRDALDDQEFTVERIEQKTNIDIWEYKPASMAEAEDEAEEESGGAGGESGGETSGGAGGESGGETSEGAGEDYSLIASEHVSTEEYSDYTLNITMPDGSKETFRYQGKPLDEDYEPDTLAEFRAASILNDALLTFVCNNANYATDAYNADPGAFADDESSPWYGDRVLSMTFTESEGTLLSADDLNALEVTVRITMRKDGALIITFSNVPTAVSTEVYKLELTLVAKVTGNSSSPVTENKTEVTVSGTEAPYTETTTTTTTNTKTMNIVWHVSDVKRVN